MLSAILNSQSAKRLGFLHTGTLKMSDDVLCVKYSPDQKLLAVSLLDCTVKVRVNDIRDDAVSKSIKEFEHFLKLWLRPFSEVPHKYIKGMGMRRCCRNRASPLRTRPFCFADIL